MSTRLTHHRAPLLGMARAALDGWFLNRRVVRLAEEQTRTEFDAALESLQMLHDAQIETSYRLCEKAGLDRNYALAMFAQVQREWEQEEHDAEFNEIAARLLHPSQGGES